MSGSLILSRAFSYIGFFVLTLSFTACQSSPSRRMERSVANTTVLRSFLGEVAQQSRNQASRELQQQVEENLKRFLRQDPSDGSHGNWVRMGITREQAMKIDSIYDDLPYMNKVQKWIMENVTVLAKEVKPSVARSAYNKILGRSGSLFDPYHGLADNVQSMAMARRNQTMPEGLKRKTPDQAKPKSVSDELRSRNTRLIAAAEKLEAVDDTTRSYLIKNLKVADDLAKNNPMVVSNIHHSMEGSLIIAKKTGRRSVGKGCKGFSEKASGEVLELKARVDMRRAELIEKKAYDKAGGAFDSADEIPADRRLTQQEVDELTEQAFQDVLGYSRREAQAALKRLKSPPCQVY